MTNTSLVGSHELPSWLINSIALRGLANSVLLHAHVKESGGKNTEVWVLPRFNAWEVRNTEFNERRLFNPRDGMLVTEGKKRTVFQADDFRLIKPPLAIQILVPTLLPIWSMHDPWKIESVVQEGPNCLLNLRARNSQARHEGWLRINSSGVGISAKLGASVTVSELSEQFEFDHPAVWWGSADNAT